MIEKELTEKQAIEGFIECCHIMEGIEVLEEKLERMRIETEEFFEKYGIKR